MKWWKFILLACMAVGAVVAQQGGQPAARAGSATAHSVVLQAPLIRILTPVANQQLSTSYVDVNFELMNPGSGGGAPNFMVQIDSREPISTSATTYTFTGLSPGQHSVAVQMVDANGTPIAGGRSAVVFFVTPNANTTAPPPGGAVNSNAEHKELASASSALPLLSVIGFGVLLGGIASALRNRG